MQITDIQRKDNKCVPTVLLVIRTYRDNHEKHCSQISVSTYIHLKNKGHFNSAHTYSDTSIVHTHTLTLQ